MTERRDVNLYLIVAAGITDVLGAYRRKFGREPERVWRRGNQWWCEVTG